MAEQCPLNPNEGGHYWIINSRTGLAKCHYCRAEAQYDIDALIYPNYKGKPRKLPGGEKASVKSIMLRFTVDVSMVEDLKDLKTNIEGQFTNAQLAEEDCRRRGHKERDISIRKEAREQADNWHSLAQKLGQQVRAVSLILNGPPLKEDEEGDYGGRY